MTCSGKGVGKLARVKREKLLLSKAWAVRYPAGGFPWRRRRLQGWPAARLAAALAPLAHRVRTRFALETARLALVWGLAAAGAMLAILYLTPQAAPVAWAGLAGLMVAALVTGWRLLNRPDALDVVRIADDLGAGGGAITAFRLLDRSSRDPWAEAAVAEGLKVCAALGRDNSYPISTSWRPWQGVIVLAIVFTVLAFLPNPLSSGWLGRREAREALAEATRRAETIIEQAEKLQVGEKELLTPGEKQELQSFGQDLRRSGSREQAAAALEEAAMILEEAGTRAGPQAGEDLAYLAAALQDMSGPGWREMGEALGRGDSKGLEAAAEALAAGLEEGGKEAREEAAMALWQQAEAVGDAGLRRELREAARGLMQAGASGGEAMQALSASLSSLATQATTAGSLAHGAATLEAMAQAMAGGGDAMAVATAAGTAGGNPAGAAGAGGNPASAGAAAGGNPGGYGSGAGQGSAGGSGSGGAGGAAGAGTAGHTGSSDGSGSGGGNGEANGSGSGQGDGTGKGTGGQGSGGHGAGTSGGGLQMVYAPSLLGGTGEQVQVSGEIREGEAGSEVTLEESPLTLGEVRPYTEVYPGYRQEAQESLVQAPLPPALEDLVWKYFTSLEPGRSEK